MTTAGIGELIMANRKHGKQAAKSKQVRGPRGKIGPKTYEDVRKIVQAKGIPLVRAFEEVAEASGRKASTIAVTYYTIARKKGGGAPRQRTISKMTKAARNDNGRSEHPVGAVKGILSQVSTGISKLEKIIGQQAREIVRLQNESKLAERIRKVLQE